MFGARTHSLRIMFASSQTVSPYARTPTPPAAPYGPLLSRIPEIPTPTLTSKYTCKHGTAWTSRSPPRKLMICWEPAPRSRAAPGGRLLYGAPKARACQPRTLPPPPPNRQRDHVHPMSPLSFLEKVSSNIMNSVGASFKTCI